jgi:hypothetical protein
MGQAICDEGVLVSYGSMSYSAPTVNVADLAFRGITLKGFMLGRALAKRDREGVQAIYHDDFSDSRWGDIRPRRGGISD